jgi:hypothetical protein
MDDPAIRKTFGLVGHAANKACPLCRFESRPLVTSQPAQASHGVHQATVAIDPHEGDDVDISPPHDDERDVDRLGQCFANPPQVQYRHISSKLYTNRQIREGALS